MLCITKPCVQKLYIKCVICGNYQHVTAMHIDRCPSKPKFSTPVQTLKTSLRNGGGENLEGKTWESFKREDRFSGPILIVKYCESHRVNANVDDQSNRTLVSPYLIDRLGVTGECKFYIHTSFSRVKTVVGQYKRIMCQILRFNNTQNFPECIKCDSISSEHLEILTP